MLFAVLVVLMRADGADACGVREGDAAYWIDNADAIVRVRVVEQRGRALTEQELRQADASMTRIGTTIRFEALEVLKGKPPRFLEFDGELTDLPELDENEPTLPRTWVRRAGRAGNCFALQYRAGEEYLLMLKRYDNLLSLYWAAMGATNEHVVGARDPWLLWVRAYLSQRAPK
jgi:hypothetical protein